MMRTLVLAARVAAVGTAVASIAIPLWITFEDRAAEASLRKLGASFGREISGGLLVELPSDELLATMK
jgi:hypothetical protein